MQEKKQHGGPRPGSGRPTTDRDYPVTIRLSKEAYDKLQHITKKSQFLDELIKQSL